MTVLDAFFCGLLLMLPNLTCSGNTYGKCFPFILNSYTCNLLIFCIKLPGLFENDRPDRRMPFIAIYNICALLMYGGLACPLNLASSLLVESFPLAKGKILPFQMKSFNYQYQNHNKYKFIV